MNNGASDRLERLEKLVEVLGQRVEANQQQITASQELIAVNQQQITATSLAVERLADVVMQVAVRVDNQVAVITQQQAAMNAELERQGRILDYLMRRDGSNDQLRSA